MFEKIFENIDDVSSPGSVGETGRLDFKRLEKHVSKSPVYQYSGSLTTPPCSEGIAWNVLSKPVFIDVKTFLKVKKVIKFNARYTQNIPGQINLLDNARKVLDGAGK